MARIRLPIAAPPWEALYSEENPAPQDRRDVFEVLGIVDGGASRRGSTYYKTLFTCPREFALDNVLGLRPLVTPEYFTVGWLFHVVLEIYYNEIKCHQDKTPIPKQPYMPKTRIAWEHFWWGGSARAMQKAMAAVEPIMSEPGYRETWAILERITGHYFDVRWKNDRWRVIAVEETIEHNGDEEHDFEYSARLDLIVQDYTLPNAMFIVEQKTARTITAELVDNYQMDLQILGQNWLVQNVLDLRALPKLMGTYVDIVTKQQQPKADRVTTNPSIRHINAFKDAIGSWSRMRAFYEGEDWPRALGKCAGAARGYTKCKYYDVCHGHPDMGVDDWAAGDPPFGFTRKDVE